MPNALLYNPEKVFRQTKAKMPSLFCRTTGFLRIMPDFFLVGVQKGGTTSLFDALYQHPQIIANKTKEMFYYGNSINYKSGKNYYKQFFATEYHKKSVEKKLGKPCFAIDASTDSFDSKEAPARIFADNKNARIVVFLRDPVERAFSQYKFSVKLGFETADFEKALELENQRIAEQVGKEHNYAFQRLGYRSRGMYAEYLENWYKVFDKKNIFVESSEAFFKDPQAVYDQLIDFLGLEKKEKVDFKKLNEGSLEKMSPATRTMLSEFYKPHNKKLFEIIGTSYDWFNP
jgi:hypothetical protein